MVLKVLILAVLLVFSFAETESFSYADGTLDWEGDCDEVLSSFIKKIFIKKGI